MFIAAKAVRSVSVTVRLDATGTAVVGSAAPRSRAGKIERGWIYVLGSFVIVLVVVVVDSV
jgi:hypothetical protein